MIYQYPAPCLTEPSVALRLEEIPLLGAEIGHNLLQELRASPRRGIGLAAPQIGINRRVFILDPVLLGIEYGPVFINPAVVRYNTEERDVQAEGCLSFPEGVNVDVERRNQLILSYFTPEGKHALAPLEGLASRAAQHECDHLDGILLLNYMTRQLRRQFIRQHQQPQ